MNPWKFLKRQGKNPISTDTIFSSALWRWKSLKRKKGGGGKTGNQTTTKLSWHSTLVHAFPWPEASPKDENSSVNA